MHTRTPPTASLGEKIRAEHQLGRYYNCWVNQPKHENIPGEKQQPGNLFTSELFSSTNIRWKSQILLCTNIVSPSARQRNVLHKHFVYLCWGKFQSNSKIMTAPWKGVSSHRCSGLLPHPLTSHSFTPTPKISLLSAVFSLGCCLMTRCHLSQSAVHRVEES